MKKVLLALNVFGVLLKAPPSQNNMKYIKMSGFIMQLVVWEENLKHNPKGSQSEGEAKCIICKFLLFKH